jgi:hypothetical protein
LDIRQETRPNKHFELLQQERTRMLEQALRSSKQPHALPQVQEVAKKL